jgi:hypothetical protein
VVNLDNWRFGSVQLEMVLWITSAPVLVLMLARTLVASGTSSIEILEKNLKSNPKKVKPQTIIRATIHLNRNIEAHQG